MFASYFKQIYRLTDKTVIRTLRNSRLKPTGPNPGLDNRIKSFEATGLRIKEENAEEFIEQSESDFHNVGEAYNEHMNETLMGKYELRHRIVKEKYFKENMPNLLTWSEKEQIRHLATTEPDEWTPERIAESFPVTVPIVKKLLKYPWKPATEKRIARHDASVMRNWKELKEGSLDIKDSIRQHFLKFSNRSIPPLRKESIKIELQQDHLGEFESIVRRCASKETSNQDCNVALPITNTDSEDVKNIKDDKTQKDSKRMTLQELNTRIKNRLKEGKNVDIPDKIIVDTLKSVECKSEVNENEIELFEEDVIKSDLVKFDTNKKPVDVMEYPERIRIPKKAHKRGATYKVNDCYYDHDGRFLYRVLGLSD